MVDPEPCKELRRRNSAAIYGDHPLLTFIYPGVEHVAGSHVLGFGGDTRVELGVSSHVRFSCPL